MLRRTMAALLALAGLVAAGLVVASATIFRPANTVTAATSTTTAVTNVAVTLPGVLEQVGKKVHIKVSAAGKDVVAVIARTADVAAFLQADRFDLITGMKSWGKLDSEVTTDLVAHLAKALPPASNSAEASAAPASSGTPSPGTEQNQNPAAKPPSAASTPAPDDKTPATFINPTNLDVFSKVVTGHDNAEIDWQVQPGQWSLLAADVTTGATSAPTVNLSWPVTAMTPWFIPGLVIAGLVVFAGMGWFGFETYLMRLRRVRPVLRPSNDSDVAVTLTKEELAPAFEVIAASNLQSGPGSPDPAGGGGETKTGGGETETGGGETESEPGESKADMQVHAEETAVEGEAGAGEDQADAAVKAEAAAPSTSSDSATTRRSRRARHQQDAADDYQSSWRRVWGKEVDGR